MADISDRIEVERLRTQVAAQEAEIARLRRAAEGGGSTRREVLKSAGLLAGGLAAAAAVVGSAGSKQAAAIEGHNVRLQGSPVYLFLKVNGTDIQGDSPVQTLDREDSIQALYFQSKVHTPISSGGLATGQRVYAPIVIRKAVDRSTPLLLQALVQNQTTDAIFKFYRPNPTGDGTEEFFYSVEIEQGRIVSFNQYEAQANDAVGSINTPAIPTMEEVQFTFSTITWTYQNGGVTFEDTFTTK